jgi:hypothetical protein
MEEQILDTDTLVEAKNALHRGQGGDSISRLANCVCILMEGFLNKLIEEQRE